MTPEEIKSQAPKGSTHYSDKYCIEYFKLRVNKIFVYDDKWYPLEKDQYEFIRSIIKPL